MRFIALQHKSTETKMENNSFAGTWEQADRLNTRQGKCDDKKRNGKSEKKKMWVHHVCNWECRRRLRHLKRFFGKNLESISRSLNAAGEVISLFRVYGYSSEFISHKFASTFIPIRAFHKAISRSCILLRFNTSRQRKTIILRTQWVYKATHNNVAIAKLVCKLKNNIAFILIER